MCGIAGYKGQRDAGRVLVGCLKRLEYRGYDSFGIGLINGGISIVKRVGRISDFKESLPESNAGIAHTRWATHGKVTETNSHPHKDCTGKIAVAHNGIIENYREIKSRLADRGHTFVSETDTEVMSHLIEEYSKSMPFKDACMKAFPEAEGSSAFVAINSEGRIAAYRCNSPLVLGIGEYSGRPEYFIASDIPAFLEYTRRAIFLHDSDFVFIDGGMEILSSGARADRKIESIEWDLEQAEKGRFPHFMLKEIAEQKETINAVSHDESGILRAAGMIRDAFGVFFVSCGSSYHSCLAASYVFSKVAGRHINVVLASEFPNYAHFITEKTLVIAVSQSGETADVLDAVRTAKGKGAKILAIVNVIGSSLTRYSDDFLPLNAGPEICVLSTKTYTSQLSLLLLLAYSLAGRLGEGRELIRDASMSVPGLTGSGMSAQIESLASALSGREHIFTIGRGVQYATALEAALKIKEVSYIHAEGFAGGELKHGPIALIEKGTPCIVFTDPGTRQTLSNAVEVRSRGGYIIGVGPQKDEAFDAFLEVPDNGAANPILQIIPIQLLAYRLAVMRGLDPDKPRNLAKAVTVR